MIAKAKNETVADRPDSQAKTLQKRTMSKADLARCKRYDKRIRDKPVKFELTENGNLAIKDCESGSDAFIEAHIKFADVFCTVDGKLKDHLLNQVAETFQGACDSQKDTVAAMNLAMAMLHEIEPRDELEVMLVVQMIAVHNQAMRLTSLSSQPKQTPECKKDSLNFAIRMFRMFTTQMETLQRYRTGGEQKVTVEHVNVNAGGQAIVGSVNAGGARRNAR